MAKKTAKNNTSAVEITKSAVQDTKVEKAAVNVDSKDEKKKANKKQAQKKNADKKPNIFQKMAKGLKGIFSELKKVTWPKGKEVAKNTAVVLTVVVLFFVVLFVIDYVLAGLLGLVVDKQWTTVFI